MLHIGCCGAQGGCQLTAGDRVECRGERPQGGTDLRKDRQAACLNCDNRGELLPADSRYAHPALPDGGLSVPKDVGCPPDAGTPKGPLYTGAKGSLRDDTVLAMDSPGWDGAWTPLPETSRMARGPAVELCCGMGGIGLGLAAAGFDIVGAWDSWLPAVQVYNHNARSAVAHVCDIVASEGMRLVRQAAKEIGEIELLAAGPPCKGFSQIRNGHHNAPNPHNEVLLAIPDYVALFRPRMVLIENVPNLERHQQGVTLRGLLTRLERPGPRGLSYRVSMGTYDAALLGTPQSRRRLLILGVRSDAGSQSLPPSSPDIGPLYTAIRHGGRVPDHLLEYAQRLTDPNDRRMTTVSQALSDLPLLAEGAPEVPRGYGSPPRGVFQRLMRIGAPRSLSGTRTPDVRNETRERLAVIPPGGSAHSLGPDLMRGLSRKHGSAYRKLHPDAPSTVLSTRYDCVYHYGPSRSLSVREYARLQGIPDVVEFPESLACRRYAYEMIGNSVPPLMVVGILQQILEGSS